MRDVYSTIRLNDQEYTKMDILEKCDNLAWLSKQEEYLKKIFLFLKEWTNDKDMILVQTSGSTGNPKTIHLKKEHMIQSAFMTQQYFQLNKNTRSLLCMPVEYISGKMMVVRAFVSGYNLFTTRPKANPFAGMKEPVDFTALTPFQLHNSLKDIQQMDIECILVGGGEISEELVGKVNNLQTKIYASYGMTETCSHVALRRVNGKDTTDTYTAMEGITFEQDGRGCLIINAPGITELSIVTNDVVELADATHFIWKARYDNVINTGGIKVFPEVIEKKISEKIRDPFIIGSIKDEILSEKVILIIEGKPLQKDEYKKLYRRLKKYLGKYEIPKEIHFIEKFQYSETGKILRKLTLNQLKSI